MTVRWCMVVALLLAGCVTPADRAADGRLPRGREPLQEPRPPLQCGPAGRCGRQPAQGVGLAGEEHAQHRVRMEVPVVAVPHAVIGEVIEDKVIDFGGAGSVTLDDARASFFHWENLL